MTPAAQGAVAVYIADFNAGIAASRDPASADLSWAPKYETGTVLSDTQQSFIYMRAHDLAYRGATPNPNLKVQTILSPTAAQLTSCLTVDPSNPWVQYNVQTGAAVPVTTRTPPPPYLLTIYMKVGDGAAWQIYAYLQNTSKTCSA